MKKSIKKIDDMHNKEFYIKSAFENVAGVAGYLAGVIQTNRPMSYDTISKMSTLLNDSIIHLEKSKERRKIGNDI